MTLNTFHFAGVSAKNVTLGVPRLKEVINVAKTLKTPSMTIYLTPETIPYNETEEQKKERDNRMKEKIRGIHSKLEYTTIENITKVSEIYYDPDIFHTIIPDDEYDVKTLTDLFAQNYEKDRENYSPWVLRLELDYEALVIKNLSMDYIEKIIKKNLEKNIDIDIICSEIKKFIRIRVKYNPEKKIDKDVCHSEEILKQIENVLFRDIKLIGVSNIKKVYVKLENKIGYSPQTGALEKKKQEWVIETDGTNLKECFLQDGIDFTRIISNDINEIYKTLGIEAVRKALIAEVRNVLRPYDIYVNYRHIAILCDVMTQRGILTSITRHGLNRADLGPIRKCSFEETVEILLEAGLFGEKDNLLGITDSVLVGQLPPLGTGAFDLLLDLNAIEQSEIPDSDGGQMFNEFEEGTPMAEDMNTPNRTPFPSNTPNVYIKANNVSFTPYGNNPNFTPGDNMNSSYAHNINDNSYLWTPNPSIRQFATSPSNYNPSDAFYNKTPVTYTPDVRVPSEYVGNSTYSPSSAGMIRGSLYTANLRKGYKETTSPRSVYSPTTPVMRPSSNSPGYIPGSGVMYSSSPRMLQESGGGSYTPMSPSYNPQSPSYNIAPNTVYSRNSPLYNPHSGIMINRDNKKEDENKKEGALSPVQSDDEDDKE